MPQGQPIRSVAVFCGSRLGADPAHRVAAVALGAGLAAAGLRLVYGGGNVGLMGAVADGVLNGGGEVLGIIPEFLQRREVAHDGVQRMILTDNMHDRKRQMFEASDAFVTMPGGLGTFDETIEITTWRQLGLHDKPILVCDVGGWAQPYLALLDAAVRQGFADPATAALYEVLPDVPAVLRRLHSATAAVAAQPGLM
ncbi:MAG: TIGR00730 family Rossman fold protein [Janthinobacterium lividum]